MNRASREACEEAIIALLSCILCCYVEWPDIVNSCVFFYGNGSSDGSSKRVGGKSAMSGCSPLPWNLLLRKQ